MCLFIWTSIRWMLGVIITSAFQYEPDVTCLQETVYLLNISFNNMVDFPALAWVNLGPLFPINLPVFFVWKRLQTSPFQNVQSDGMHPAVYQNTNHVGNIKGFWDVCPIIGFLHNLVSLEFSGVFFGVQYSLNVGLGGPGSPWLLGALEKRCSKTPNFAHFGILCSHQRVGTGRLYFPVLSEKFAAPRWLLLLMEQILPTRWGREFILWFARFHTSLAGFLNHQQYFFVQQTEAWPGRLLHLFLKPEPEPSEGVYLFHL